MLRDFCRAVLDLLFPPRCPLCGRYVAEQGLFCPGCHTRIIHVRKVPLDRRYIHTLGAVYALTDYHSGMNKMLHDLKYQNKLGCLTHIHRVLARNMPREILSQQYFVPVPLHHTRQKERGFNQTQEIYGKWVKENNFCWLDGLERRRETMPQFSLSSTERRRNMIKAFAVKGDIDIHGKNIVLLDDIFTTGATMEASAKALRKAGAGSIIGLALASDA